MGFDFNLFDKYGERMVREGLSEYLYLLMLMKLCALRIARISWKIRI